MTSLQEQMVWDVVHEERRALIEDLAGLPPAQWATPSPCPGWDVHDALAHLVDTARTTRIGFLGHMVMAGFDFDRANAQGVSRERTADPRRTLESLHTVQSRMTGPPAPLATRLVEAFVHGEDIRRPLGIRRDYPLRQVVAALKCQVATSTRMGGGAELVDGLRLLVSDANLWHGDGPEVSGSAMALLLAVSGRAVAPGELSGPGVARLMGQ
ncbi:MAG: maleylpyruvate isomerase family mycothiol-dependent enzyme [Arachnia sp.]